MPSTGAVIDRVAEVELRLVLHRLLLGERRGRLGDLRLENANLPLGGGDNRDVVLQRGVFFANVGLRLLGPLHGAPTVLGQLGVALEILLRKDERRLIRRDLMAALLDHELLLIDLLAERVDGRLRRGDIGASLIERGLVITRINAREHFARLHRLIVVDRRFGEIARHLGADQNRMRLNVSIIGRDQKPARPPVVVAVTRGRREQQHRPGGDQQLLQRPPAAPGPGRGSVDGPGIANELLSRPSQRICYRPYRISSRPGRRKPPGTTYT